MLHSATRKNCKACRLKKCLQANMNKSGEHEFDINSIINNNFRNGSSKFEIYILKSSIIYCCVYLKCLILYLESKSSQSRFRNGDTFFQLVRHPFVEPFDVQIWCKCRKTVEWPTFRALVTSRIVFR
uniref:Nuclear receptor domain-containing protein n=1 Tax=Heterorhabditis bacteriophora TaxID=37862 RepID=A0A1I7WUA8_HETBA